MKRNILFAILIIFVSVVPSLAAEVAVATASDLGFAVKEIITDFEKAIGNKVKLSLGSSGAFATQIENGAPFDVFLSADIAYPQDLGKKGFTEPKTTFVYAVGRIVVWVPKNSSIDVEKLGINALLQPQIRKIAIANPEHAPYGRAAVSAMQHFGVYETVKNKLVLGENISQAAQFVQSEAAEIGIVALSLALSDPMRASGKYWQVPFDAYPRMDQAGVILKHARSSGNLDAARAFVNALQSPSGRAVLGRYGFSLPTAVR